MKINKEKKLEIKVEFHYLVIYYLFLLQNCKNIVTNQIQFKWGELGNKFIRRQVLP